MPPKSKENQGSPRARGISYPVAKRLYTLPEAAQYLGRSEWGMRELIWSRKIPIVRPEGSRKIFLDIADLDDFIERSKSLFL